MYQEALRMAEAIEDFPAIAVNSLNLAGIRRVLGDFSAAHRALDRLLGAPAHFEQWAIAEAEGHKALLSLEAGELDAAGEWLTRAESRCAAPACRIQTALLNLNARLLLERGAAAEAGVLAQRAATASRADGNREEEANALRLEGRAASRLGEHARALALLNQALEIDRRLALPHKIGLDLLALAEAELARGERRAALGYAQRALDVSRAAGDRAQQDAARRLLEERAR
jgi:tetratricopeptide (TPR) repeat protein